MNCGGTERDDVMYGYRNAPIKNGTLLERSTIKCISYHYYSELGELPFFTLSRCYSKFYVFHCCAK